MDAVFESPHGVVVGGPTSSQLTFPTKERLFNWWRKFFNKRLDDISCAFYGFSKAELAITVYRKTGA